MPDRGDEFVTKTELRIALAEAKADLINRQTELFKWSLIPLFFSLVAIFIVIVKLL